jgi:hypothetical protein
MQIDPEEFRRHYDSLSDEALLEVNRDELVAVAQECYDEELARRGIAREAESDAAAPAESATHADWVAAATFLSAEEANLAHAMLDSADIPARLESKGTGAWTGFGELRLLVPTEFLAEAQEIIESQISEEELIAQAEAETAPDSEDEI